MKKSIDFSHLMCYYLFESTVYLMITIKEEVSKNLLYFRKKSNLTQKELADKIGVKHNSISSWENGTNSIDIEILFNICSALNVSINDMYGQYGAQNSNNLSSREENYIKKYRSLNESGKKKAEAYLTDLIGNPSNMVQNFDPTGAHIPNFEQISQEAQTVKKAMDSTAPLKK